MKSVDGATALDTREPLAQRPVVDRPQDDRVAAPALSSDADSMDARLVRRCLEGDQDAWCSLLERYKRLIYSIPVKYGLTQSEATDIFQDVCVELLAELPRLREPRALPKWLSHVTAHKCSQLKRLTNRQPSAPAETIEDMADSGDLTEQVLLDVEREQALRDAVAALPPRCRQLIHALFYETPAKPYREIARDLNLACGSIGFIRGRCLGRLRTELRKNGFR
ncbi:MAG TPA: sigma-70 family RNA polymerase sigma factor [Vicinamibacterales bacterium]